VVWTSVLVQLLFCVCKFLLLVLFKFLAGVVWPLIE
jgi:hypothetical protein